MASMTIFLEPDGVYWGSVPSKDRRLGSVSPNSGGEAWVCDLCGVFVCACMCVCRKHQCWLHMRTHLQRLPNQAAMPLNMAPTTESFSRLENAELWELQSVEVESRLLSTAQHPHMVFILSPNPKTGKLTETGKFYHVSRHWLHIITIQ